MTKIDRNWDKVIENNFLDKISDLPILHPKMRIYRYSASVVCVFGLVESDTFNVIFGGNFDDPRITVIAKEIISLYRKKNLPYAWWVGPSSRSERSHEILNQLGLSHTETEIGMMIRVDEISAVSSYNLDIVMVETEQELVDFSHVFASTGDKEALIYYKMVEPYIKDSKTKLFVKYCNYVPVATASVILNKGNTAGIYDIITHPEFRCRGFGTSITKFALNYIKEQGYKYACLQASEEGLSMYLKLGFVPHGEFLVYSNK